MSAKEEWVVLQKKIFTRWVNQKIESKGKKVDDVVTGFKDGTALVSLVEALSEKKCEKKLQAPAKMRVQQIDNANNALAFTFANGVQLELKPSAENLVDGTEKQVLGLVWGIMRRFLKFSDDDDQEKKHDIQEGLLMWVQNQTAGYKGVNVVDFGKSFHDGLALCAIIHKNRPKLINFESLDPNNKLENLKIAFNAAERYFGLEQYLQPSDIQKLDDKSMLIYVAEYYYGVARQRKIDLAARRIGKLIKFTEENDAMREEHKKRVAVLKENMDRNGKILGDRTVDNNMAGARRRLEEFYEYKDKDKNVIVKDYLECEGVYNHLAMRLADHQRPPYTPPAGLTLKDLKSALDTLETHEAERAVALQAEFNRQNRLVQLDEQHKQKCEKINAWSGTKNKYLSTKENVTSSGSAQYHLNALSAYEDEFKNMRGRTFADVVKLGNELEKEKYEHIATVRARESNIEKDFTELERLSAAKLLVLKDDLARETVREHVVTLNKQHQERLTALQAWGAEKKAYLDKEEEILSVPEALTQIGNLEYFVKEREDHNSVNGKSFRELAKEIIETKYETQYSKWQFENPDEIKKRVSDVDLLYATLEQLAAKKSLVLKDALTREQFKEVVRNNNQQHIDLFEKLKAFHAEKAAYLHKKEHIESISEAQTQLNLLESYRKEKQDAVEITQAALLQRGKEILEAKYETQYSKWQFENPSEVQQREALVADNMKLLDSLAQAKSDVLQDDLARELFKEHIRQLNKLHADRYEKFNAWFAEKKAYLEKKEHIESVSAAQVELNQLESLQKERVDTISVSVNALKALGKEILEAKYATQHSNWVFEKPEEVRQRESAVDNANTLLDQLHQKKLAVLKDDLAREQLKEKVRQLNQEHIDRHKKWLAWFAEKKAFLEKKENVNSISSANLHLSLLDSFDKEKVEIGKMNIVALEHLGKEILNTQHNTEHSKWQFENAGELQQRLSELEARFGDLGKLSAAKREILNDDLAREKFIQSTRLLNNQHKVRHDKLSQWTADKLSFLRRIEEIDSISDAKYQLGLLDAFEKEKKENTPNVDALKKLGAEITSAKYETKFSKWVFETPEEVRDREAFVDQKWNVELTQAADEKKKALEAALQREVRKEELRLQFANRAGDFAAWAKEAADNIASTAFGFTFLEVQAFENTLNANDQEVASVNSDKKTACDRAFSELQSMNVKSNNYTTHTPSDVSNFYNSVVAALDSRKSAYKTELEKQRKNDELCKRFADVVDPFIKLLLGYKEKITESKEELEAQLAFVNQRLESNDGAPLPQVKALQEEITKAGITYNRHCPHNARDVDLQFGQYQAFLQRKKVMLQEEIELKKLKGITPEQLKEIETQFKQFDKNNDGSLEKKEIKACLYSLGEDRSNAEVNELMSKYGDGKEMKFEGFKEFMIKQLGDTETKEEVLNGLKLINKGKDVAVLDEMELVLEPHDIEYFKKTADKGADGSLLYDKWVDTVFSK